MRDEERVLKELQELNQKYQREMKGNRSDNTDKETEQPKQKDSKTDNEQEKPLVSDHPEDQFLNIERPTKSSRSSSRSKKKKPVVMKEYPDSEDALRMEEAKTQIDPMKKQM